MQNKQVEQARALYYKFFGIVFGFIDESTHALLCELVELFAQNPLDEGSSESLNDMKLFLDKHGVNGVKEESDNIFVSPESTFIPMSASYYDEGRDDGKKRCEAVALLLRSAFRKNEFMCRDSEDSIVFLCRFMNALIQDGVGGDESSLELAKEVFVQILNDVFDDFDALLFAHENAVFYKNTAIVLNAFIEFERFYLSVAPSLKSASSERVSMTIKKDRKPITQKIRRNPDEIVL